MTLRFLFLFLWSSAAIAIKIGLTSAPPLTLAAIRFLSAGILLFIFFCLFTRKIPFPKKEEWMPLIILGFLNSTMYLGLSFWALKTVSAGIFNLFVAVNPFAVAILSKLFLNRSIDKKEWIGMIISAAGLGVATFPRIRESSATTIGLCMLAVGMIAMAVGSVYYKKINLQIPKIAMNSYQLLFGGLLLLPFSILIEANSEIKLDVTFLGSLLWLVVAVSIGAMILWFHLLDNDAVKANNLLLATPVLGYILGAIFLHEAITSVDVIGTVLVLSGLLCSGSITITTRKVIKN